MWKWKKEEVKERKKNGGECGGGAARVNVHVLIYSL